MAKDLKPISYEEFSILSKIRFSNINDGFSKYINGILEIDDNQLSDLKGEEKYINFVKEVYRNNKSKPIIMDFYLKNIDEEGILRILEGLDYEDKLILLKQLRNENKETVYFKIENEEILPFVTRLSTRELLFCTIHFLEKPLTLWGNYNLKFPVFFKNSEDISFYDRIARENGLTINSIIL
jgi:hypothetical protein